MSTYYTVKVPSTDDMSSYTTTAAGTHSQTVEECALQDYNSARAHDGLPPVKRMPAGTKYERIVT